MGNNNIQRQVFSTSRLMDFFSEKELVTQTGHTQEEWPLVCLKELVDNALDACEEAETPPVISVIVDEAGIIVQDNGPGIPAETVEKMLDYTVRVSSRAAYVSPSRGAQGNALKTLIAMPFVLHGDRGEVEIISEGIIHEITVEVDRIHQEPCLARTEYPANVKTGSKIRIYWPSVASSLLRDAKEQFLQMAESFAFLNPHLDLTVEWFDEVDVRYNATNTEWRKWTDNMASSAHWYDLKSLRDLISSYIGSSPGKTVRDFVAEFRGLAGSTKQKKVLEPMGVARATLEDAFVSGGDIDMDQVTVLLDRMRECSTPPAPKLLGMIGKDHIQARMEQMGCDMETFGYQKELDLDADGMPSTAEVGFAMLPGSEERTLITGVNWSGSIGNPFKQLGKYGVSMDTLLGEALVSTEDPVVLLIHMACPAVAYSDHGKSSVMLED